MPEQPDRPRLRRPAEGFIRAHNRGTLSVALQGEALVVGIRISAGRQVFIETKSWDLYWGDVTALNDSAAQHGLAALRAAWLGYVESHFAAQAIAPYCLAYFVLLDSVTESPTRQNRPRIWRAALQSMLGFQCFLIRADDPSAGTAAGTSTVRNPCYLLARLKNSAGPEDTRLLPLIALGADGGASSYYHYRQIALGGDAGQSLLLFVDSDLTRRGASFRTVNSFLGCLGLDSEPWLHERVRRLVDGVLRPLVTTQSHANSVARGIEFVEIGAGTGALTGLVCRQLAGLDPPTASKVRAWFVDLDAAEPARFFQGPKERSLVDSVAFVAADYRQWLSRPRPLPDPNGLRIALVSRLFNNLSLFSVRRLGTAAVRNVFGGRAAKDHFAVECLGRPDKGPSTLLLSGGRTELPDGSQVYNVLSLSGYYRAIFAVLSPMRAGRSADQGAYVPTRTFNPDCLFTSDGRSVIGRLMETCAHIYIEDADMRAEDLTAHIEDERLGAIALEEHTRALRLRGNRSFLLGRKPAAAPGVVALPP